MLKKQKIILLSISLSMALLATGCGSSDTPTPTPTPGTTPTPTPTPGTTPTPTPGTTPTPTPTGSFDRPDRYTGFPVTLADITGKDTSVSYGGQMARHVMREQIKTIVKADKNATATEAELLAELDKYMKNPEKVLDDATIIAPVTKGTFIIKETKISELSTGKSIYSSTYAGHSKATAIAGADVMITLGVPGDKDAKQVLDLWSKNYAINKAAGGGYVDENLGYDYSQLFPKYIMGAVFYFQAMNRYADEYVKEVGTKDNSLPYGDDDHYTGKEHSWDEAFGYFGAAANFGELTPAQNHGIKKRKEAHFGLADWNDDDAVSLYTEYTSGPAYYAAGFDKVDGSSSTYSKKIMDAWLDGRTLIANTVDANGVARNLTTAERATLVGHVGIILENWEKVLAEAVYKYAGEAHEKIAAGTLADADKKDYFKYWSEAKGFMLSLQFGGADSIIDKAKFEEIDNLLGMGPVLADGSQVTGITDDVFTKSAAGTETLEAFAGKLKEIQTKLDALYSLEVKQYPID